MKTIAVDIDEVLARHNHALANFYNKRYGTSLTEEDFFTEQWAEVWQVSKKEAEERAQEFHGSNIHAAFEPLENAYEVLSQLKENHELVVVTVRRRQIIDLTYQWLDTNYPGIFNGIHFIHFWDEGNTTTKAELCKNLNASWLLDDSVKHASEMYKYGKQGLLFGQYSWNKADTLPPGVVRLKNWTEVGEFFRILKQAGLDGGHDNLTSVRVSM